jgi:hypothetical protein
MFRIARTKAAHVPTILSSTSRAHLRANTTQTSIVFHPSSRNMATGSKVHLETSQQPQFYVKGLTAESAEKTSQLLQVNHEKHHIFFNKSGFHVRHSLEVLGAIMSNEIDRTTLPITSSRSSPSTRRPRRSSKAMMPTHIINAHLSR